MQWMLVVMLAKTWATDEIVSTRCGRLRLGFDRATGQWCELALARNGENLLGTEGGQEVEVIAPDHSWPAERDWKSQPLEVESSSGGWRLRIVRRSPEWTVTATYRVSSGSPLIRRQDTLRWEGAEPVKIVGTLLRVPGVTLAGARDACWCLPGNYPLQERPLASGVAGRSTREQGWTWSDTGCAYVRSPERGLGMLVGYALAADHASVAVEEVDAGVSLVHRFDTLAILHPGEEIEVGVQWIQVTEQGEKGLRKAATALAQRVNLGPPKDRPAWLAGAVLQELHPWGRLESWNGGDRGYRMPRLQAQLPYLRDLGVTGIWLLPVSHRPPWVYFLPRFRNIDEAVTTPEQLRSFIATGHQLGLRTLLDLVTYGISPDSPDVASLPDTVWCVDENGERQKAWGGTVLAADCSDPDWNSHIVDLGSYWVREFGGDGFRLDCGGSGQAPNWQPRSGPRANLALQAGGIQQNSRLRRAIRRLNPDAVLMPEAGAPCYFRSADLLFDYPFYMVCREITREPRTDRWVAQTRQWLAAQQMTHSPRQQAALVRFLENHDTVAAAEFFGVGPSQALTALCAFLPGVLLLYQEEEIGFAPELRTWLRLRQELPELKGGQADYESVMASDPRVLAFLRFTGEEASLVAINFGPTDSVCHLAWPEKMVPQGAVCQDALTGERIPKNQPVSLPAYRPRILTLRASPRKASSTSTSLPPSPVPAPPMWERTEDVPLQDEWGDRHRQAQAGGSPAVQVDPLWVTVSNDYYTAAFARRHGGTLFSLNHAGEDRSCLAASEVYTDWGLFEQGLHVATEWETNPRLEIHPQGKGTEITFRGRLRRPSWNGVQTGYVIEPPVAYRLTYTVNSSPVIRVTLGLSSTTDRPDTKAFFAYRLPFVGVDRWEIQGIDPSVQGRPGEKPGQRVFQAGGETVGQTRVEMVLTRRGRSVRLRSFRGDPMAPQNPFLLDGGEALHFFFALLNGGAVALQAHREWAASFEMVLD